MVKATSARCRPVVSVDGAGVVDHCGAVALVELADTLGLTAALRERPSSRRRRRSAHDPGAVLRDLIVSIADGATGLADLAVLRNQPDLFGAVAPHATAWRTIERIADDELGGIDGIEAARAAARKAAWTVDGQVRAPMVDGMVIVDVDATLVTAHSDKDQAAATYKRGFGFHPLLAFVDHGPGRTGEAVAGIFRPGNAGANTASDHCHLLYAVLDSLPVDPEETPMLVRADTAGATHGFIDAIVDAGAMFSVGFDITEALREAILGQPAGAWHRSVDQHDQPRPNGQVTDITARLDLSGWPTGSRVIVRRERPHPGAQYNLFDPNGYRHTAFITNQPDTNIVELERRHRAHARVEDRIRNNKDCGLARFPFENFERNAVWLQLVLSAQALLAWFQLIGCTGTDHQAADPKTLRYRLIHVAARFARHARTVRLRINTHWPWKDDLAAAFERIRAHPATV